MWFVLNTSYASKRQTIGDLSLLVSLKFGVTTKNIFLDYLWVTNCLSFFYYCIANWLTLTLYNHNSGKRAYLYGTNFSFSYSCHSFNLVDFSKKEVSALKCNSMAKKIFEWNTTFVFEYNNLCICHISNTICIGRKCFSDFRRKMMARTFCISPFTFGYFSSLILWCCESHYVGKL